MRTINQIIKDALEEDIQTGDITTKAILSNKILGKGIFLAKENGIAAGFDIVKKVFYHVDKSLKFKKYFSDGDKIKTGDTICIVEGKASSILKAERTALNFFQRMSGIATLANQYQEKIKHTKAKIIDTRKTVPGLRIIDKLAVKLSGCENHRMGLYDMFLIKDNHIEAAGSITKAIEACKNFQKKIRALEKSKNYSQLRIEVETTNLNQVKEALENKVDIIMLDNFDLKKMKKAVEMINHKCKVEASGGINLNTVKKIAETGVDFISVGALTHSVKALDISLELKIN